MLAIGANDFHPDNGPYQNIYAGNWTQAEIDDYVNEKLANIETAMDTVLPTGVQLVVANVSDYGLTATMRILFPSVVGRQRAADAISQLNDAIDASAQARELVVVDMFGAGVAIFGPHDAPKTDFIHDYTPQSPMSVPVLPPWGLAILAALLPFAALAALRRRATSDA